MKNNSFHENLCIEYGIASKIIPGEIVCGDRHLVKFFSSGALAAVIDGLGHGEDASFAAEKAVEVLENITDEPLDLLVNRCHEALRRTNGVAMSVASFHPMENTLTWIGVGNVEGVVCRKNPGRGPSHESLLMRGGVVGYNISTLRCSSISFSEGDTLVFVTDGIRSDFSEILTASELPQALADSIMSRFWRKTDDALALVVRYLGGNQ
jgi:phosphoserine phosphatase RsbX